MERIILKNDTTKNTIEFLNFFSPEAFYEWLFSSSMTLTCLHGSRFDAAICKNIVMNL